jgi:hypothetical protein
MPRNETGVIRHFQEVRMGRTGGFCQAEYALRLFVAALTCFGIAGSSKSLSQPSLSADQWGIEEACPRSLGPTLWRNCLTLAQRWVAETCPRSLGPSLYTDCVRREVEALRKAIADVISSLPRAPKVGPRDLPTLTGSQPLEGLHHERAEGLRPSCCKSTRCTPGQSRASSHIAASSAGATCSAHSAASDAPARLVG